MRLRAGLAAVAVVVAAPGASRAVPASAQEPRVAPLYRPAVVAGYGRVIAWSDWSPVDERYHLVVRRDNRTELPAVAPRAVPFDVDAGPGPDGGVVLSYSRCGVEPPQPEPRRRLPDWSAGRTCDLYRYDVASGTETRLAGASTVASSEYLPSIWRDEVAFARVYERRSGRRGRLPYLYVRPLRGAGGSQRQPGGARGDEVYENGPASLDLYGRRLSFVWDRFAPPGSPGGVPRGERFFDAELRLDMLAGRHARLDVAAGDSVNKDVFFAGPVGDQGRIFYAQDCLGSCPPAFTLRLFAYRISQGRTSSQRLPATTTTRAVYVSLVRDNGIAYAVRGPADVDPGAPPAQDWEIVQVPSQG